MINFNRKKIIISLISIIVCVAVAFFLWAKVKEGNSLTNDIIEVSEEEPEEIKNNENEPVGDIKTEPIIEETEEKAVQTPTPVPVNGGKISEQTQSESEVTIQSKVFGYSVKNRPIEGYVIGNGDDCLFMFGAIHGNEMSSAALMNRLVSEIKKNPKLVGDDMKVIILPIANPDGYYDREDKLNANEVNLNLNFDTTQWQMYGTEKGHFAGSEPFSEPESKVIRSIVEEYEPRRMISFHARGALVNPEYSHTNSYSLAYWYTTKTGYLFYDDISWDYFGTATRWFKEKYDGAAITVELTDFVNSDWSINKTALLELISQDFLI